MSSPAKASLPVDPISPSELPAGYEALFNASPTPLLVVAPPEWTIVAANDARLRVTGTTREEQIGRRLFDVFPDDSQDPDADGVRNLTASLERVVATRTTDVMAVQRYALRGPDGCFVDRWWTPTNAPVLGPDGEVVLIVHHVEDFTDAVRARYDSEGHDAMPCGEQAVVDRLRLSEAELRDAQERYSALFNAIDQGFCTIEVAFDEQDRPTDYKFLEISPSFERQTGIENGQGRWMRDIAADQDQFWFDVYGHVAKTGESARFESFSTPLARWWNVFAFRIRGERRVAVLFSDITDRKRAESVLRESEARFRHMADSAPVMIWVTDPSGFCTRLNARWYEFTGQEPGTGEGYGWLDAVHPDDREAAQQAFNKANAEQCDYRVDFRLRRADGVYRWTIDAAAARFDDDGEFLGYVGSVIDIHERRVAEEALRESDQALRALNADLERKVTERALARGRTWQLSPEIMGVLNAEGYFEQSNPAWARILGWSEEEVASTIFFDFIHPDDQPRSRATWLDAIGHGIPALQFENRYRAKDGNWHWLSWVAVPDDGKVYCSARDVTADRTQAEALNEVEEALRQSQKMESLGQLTGGVAHDFNNLLTVIRSSADLLRRDELPEARRRRYIDAISDTADRAARLTAQLLAFSRRSPLKAEVFGVPDRLTGISEMIRTMLGPRIELTIEADCDDCFVEADPTQFETALVNVVVNARDAMAGEGSLVIGVQAVDMLPATRGHAATRGEFVAVSIVDTGSGIAADQIERIFEPFFTTKDVGKGTGLGLSQVFGFAKQSGGEVEVKSELGTGTTFTLYLPRADSSRAPASVSYENDSTQGRGRVLVVEDNVQVGEFAAQLLGDLGYETQLASSATDALGVLESRPGGFDIVFSDVVMPGMGGVEFAQRLREQWPKLPVVLTSGYSHVLAEDARHGFPLLHKPYSVEDLSRILREAMATRTQAG